MIIMGYGRSGQLIAQLLSENLIPFVAVDSSTNQVSKGKVSNASEQLPFPTRLGKPPPLICPA